MPRLEWIRLGLSICVPISPAGDYKRKPVLHAILVDYAQAVAQVVDMTTKQIEEGTAVRVENKYGDEIAAGVVTEVERDGFSLDSGDAILFRQVSNFDGQTIQLTVAS